MTFHLSKYKSLKRQHKIIRYLLTQPVDEEDKALLQNLWVAVTTQMIKMEGPESVERAIHQIENIRHLNADVGSA